MTLWIARRGVVVGVAIGGLAIGRSGAMPLTTVVGEAVALVAVVEHGSHKTGGMPTTTYVESY